MKHDLRELARSCPLTLALSPNTKNVLGEREHRVGTLTQGGARDSFPSLALGYSLAAPLGLSKEEAASCRFQFLKRFLRDRHAIFLWRLV